MQAVALHAVGDIRLEDRRPWHRGCSTVLSKKELSGLQSCETPARRGCRRDEVCRTCSRTTAPASAGCKGSNLPEVPDLVHHP